MVEIMGKISISLSKNLNKIINIPYIIIFTSENFKAVLSQEELDEKRNLSYDSIIIVLDPFFDPIRVISSFDKLISKIENPDIQFERRGRWRGEDKHQ